MKHNIRSVGRSLLLLVILIATSAVIVMGCNRLADSRYPDSGIIINKTGNFLTVKQDDGDTKFYHLTPEQAKKCTEGESWPECLPYL